MDGGERRGRLVLVAQDTWERHVPGQQFGRRRARRCDRARRMTRDQVAEWIGLRRFHLTRPTAKRERCEYDAAPAQHDKRRRDALRHVTLVIIFLKLVEVAKIAFAHDPSLAFTAAGHLRPSLAANYLASFSSASPGGRSIRSGALIPTIASAWAYVARIASTQANRARVFPLSHEES